MKKMVTAFISTWLFMAATTFAANATSSYTTEEMHRLAAAYIILADRDSSKMALSFDAAIEAGEFKGYVASLLDNGFRDNEKVAACKSRLTVKEIAHKSALSIAASPANGPGNAGKRLQFAVLLACNEGT